jgi:hypothetical protein
MGAFLRTVFRASTLFPVNKSKVKEYMNEN